MQLLFELYVETFAVALPVFAVAILIVGAVRAGLTAGQTATAGVFAATLLGVWYAAAAAASREGLLMPPPTLFDPPYVLGFLFGGALLIWALIRFNPLALRIARAAPLSLIAGFQIPRVMGVIFLIGWAAGEIPAAFAIPAGLGDIWAGIAGYRASRALAANDPSARRLLRQANIIGLADFAVAVGTGLITSEGFAHFLAKDSPNIINLHPLALFPAFFVPIFIGFHLIAIERLRETENPLPADGQRAPAE